HFAVPACPFMSEGEYAIGDGLCQQGCNNKEGGDWQLITDLLAYSASNRSLDFGGPSHASHYVGTRHGHRWPRPIRLVRAVPGAQGHWQCLLRRFQGFGYISHNH